MLLSDRDDRRHALHGASVARPESAALLTHTSRRAVLTGGLACAAAAFAPTGVLAAEAKRRFRVMRGEDEIGWQTNAVSRTNDRLDVAVDIEIKVKILGITAYRYEMTNREVWEGGVLTSLDAETNDDGTKDFARVRRDGDTLRVEGSAFTGAAPLDAVSTTYWSPEFLRRRVWISTQTGAPLNVRASKVGPATVGDRTADLWRVTGDLPLDLYYDAAGDWVANVFDASGEEARIEYQFGPPLAPLWYG